MANISAGFQHVKIESLRADENQPRRKFDKEQIRELADSLMRDGIWQPIVCRQTSVGLTIVCGERRYRAAQLAGLKEVPAIVHENMDDETALVAQLTENIQRADLLPLERAEAFAKLLSGGMTQADLAAKLGISRSSVANTMRMLDVPSSWNFAMERPHPSGAPAASEAAVLQLLRLRILDEIATCPFTKWQPYHPAKSWAEWWGIHALYTERPVCRTAAECKQWADRVLAWTFCAVLIGRLGAPRNAWLWLLDDGMGPDAEDALCVAHVHEFLQPRLKKLTDAQWKRLQDASDRIDLAATPRGGDEFSEFVMWERDGLFEKYPNARRERILQPALWLQKLNANAA